MQSVQNIFYAVCVAQNSRSLYEIDLDYDPSMVNVSIAKLLESGVSDIHAGSRYHGGNHVTVEDMVHLCVGNRDRRKGSKWTDVSNLARTSYVAGLFLTFDRANHAFNDEDIVAKDPRFQEQTQIVKEVFRNHRRCVFKEL